MHRNNAFFYLRLSKEDDKFGESASIENQREILHQYLQKTQFVFSGEYVDEHVIIGTSGENLVKSRASALVPFQFFVRASTVSFKSLNIIMEGCAYHVKNNRSMQ